VSREHTKVSIPGFGILGFAKSSFNNQKSAMIHYTRSSRIYSQGYRACRFSTEVLHPSQLYQRLVDSKQVHEDLHQRKALLPLDKLHDEILQYNKTMSEKRNSLLSNDTPKKSSAKLSLMSNWLMSTKSAEIQSQAAIHVSPPKSVYLYGGTGSGKTFMMDLFYENIPISLKKRVHFHSFMIDIHKRFHQLRESEDKSGSIIDHVVREIIKDAYLICFDEFQVTDIADAMLLKSLFTKLWEEGAVFVATSNRPPSDLYKHGLQRELFIPFIKLLEEKAVVHSITASSTDYRLLKSEEQAKYFYITPLSEHTAGIMDRQFDRYRRLTLDSQQNSIKGQKKLRNYELLSIKPLNLMIHGHQVFVPAVIMGRRVARFSFHDLCHGRLGAEDYIVMAKLFQVIFITGIPQMSINHRDEVRRFITCIDAFYEAGIRLVLSAAKSPLELFQVSSEDRLNSNYDEIFAFDRTASRLLEMKSTPYLEATAPRYGHGLNYVESILTPLIESSGQQSAKFEINHVHKLWEYYYIPCQTADYRDQATLASEVLDVAIRDILVVMKVRKPQLLQALYYRYGIREIVNREPVSESGDMVMIHREIVVKIRDRFQVQTRDVLHHQGVQHDVFDEIVIDMIHPERQSNHRSTTSSSTHNYQLPSSHDHNFKSANM
jgi:peroxisome-assembly ATPase